MRNTLPIENPFPENDLSNNERLTHPSRRNFLRTLGVAGVATAAIALTPNRMFAKPALTASQWEKGCEDWVTCVTELVTAIYRGNSQSDTIIKALRQSKLYLNPDIDSDNIHDRYSARHVFAVEIDYDEVICTNGFMVKRLPFYGLTCGCPTIKDLNGPEISRITSSSAISYFGCVLSPDGYRRAFDENLDHANYQKVINKSTNHDPADWTPSYVRTFVKKKTGEKFPAFGISNKTETDDFGDPNGDVIIGSFNV